MNGNLADELRRERILAIVRGSNPEAAIQTALTLMECGIRILEVSLVGADALRVISEIVAAAPDGCLVGAGTVLSKSDVEAAATAGASFMVTPALAESVAESVAIGIPVLAGAFTPTEVVRALELGAAAVKLFPASLGGPEYLRALRGPFPAVPFVPVGGVDAAFARECLESGATAVGIGSPLIGDAAGSGDLVQLRQRAKAFLTVAGDFTTNVNGR